ncbi:MAG: diacylglycerol kinase [Erysipelotrichaceae bacterium]|jgi:diacylglycerol kinase|nr:diacylglycerol kinase [Erysipelotrichaceae bacterium]
MKKKFAAAFRGLFSGFKDISILTQWILAALALIAGCIMHLSTMEWIAVALCIGLVIVTEMVNTCIERTCDMIMKEWSSEVRYIKDLAAGAVVAAAITALICALIILFRHL